MLAVIGMAAFGAWNFTRLPIDAIPDITNVQSRSM
jgi:cobalt-zinc-cadmium resistance protein CzcA